MFAKRETMNYMDARRGLLQHFFRVLMFMNTAKKTFLKIFGFYIVLIIIKMDSNPKTTYFTSISIYIVTYKSKKAGPLQ